MKSPGESHFGQPDEYRCRVGDPPQRKPGVAIENLAAELQ